MCFCLFEWNRQQPGKSPKLEHGIKQEVVQSPKALIYHIESHRDCRRKVIWPEESDKFDQFTTIKSSSPTDDSSATAD